MKRAWILCLCTIFLWGISGCRQATPTPPSDIVGRWAVQGTPGLTIPHSFFWFTMDYLEFRDDGTVLALMTWPPDGGAEIRLNTTTRYTLRGDNQIEFEGSCRHEDPCTGVYTVTRTADTLRIFGDSGALTLQWVAPPADTLPPAAGPAPSPTPAAMIETPVSPATTLLFAVGEMQMLDGISGQTEQFSRYYHPPSHVRR